MRIYLDTSVINAYLFGKYSTNEADRFTAANKLFGHINAKRVTAVVSLYSIQEIFSFCRIVFTEDAGHVSRSSLSSLMNNEIELTDC